MSPESQQHSSEAAEASQPPQRGLDGSSREHFRSLRGRDAQFGYVRATIRQRARVHSDVQQGWLLDLVGILTLCRPQVCYRRSGKSPCHPEELLCSPEGTLLSLTPSRGLTMLAVLPAAQEEAVSVRKAWLISAGSGSTLLCIAEMQALCLNLCIITS